jgi:hypothetical protein
MNEITEIQNSLRQLKNSSQQLNKQICNIKNEKDITINHYISNLKRMSLQALDLFSALEKQTLFLQNQKTIISRRQQQKGNVK